ncbi:5'-adenylylsulfate reductase-like 5 [Ipomoea triloba]|uniref:5'-adenylylsulfate reductase-like 5 n=1 Tax=Ipomoea triloba TaxID=35885 RepID=UPI00125DDD2B|nr:5'-adenylylsulfate reductase-like 5 [Ipomoea triloba]
MASSTIMRLFLLCVGFVSSIQTVLSSSPSSICRFQSRPAFLNHLRSQCPLSVSLHPPLEVSGEFIERLLASTDQDVYTSVLFYASWCPFSKSFLSVFEDLKYMYPQIEHVAVEQSSATPRLLSRYGIHSFPAILMVNQTLRVRFHGSKDLTPLIMFYRKTTGHVPVHFIGMNRSGSSRNDGNPTMGPNIWPSLNDKLVQDPYLVFAMAFLCLRAILFVCLRVWHQVKALCVRFEPHLNLGIIGENSQILGRILHMLNVKMIWTRLRLCKNRNFHHSATNARLWASSFPSVSLGESSTSR